MEVAVIGSSRGAMITAALLGVGNFTLNDVLYPPPPPLPTLDRELNTPIFQLALEKRLRKRARRTLEHRLMKLFIVEARKRPEQTTRREATVEFTGLWNRAQADWRRYQQEMS